MVGSLNGKTGHLTKIVNHLDTNKNREYEFDVIGRLTKAKGGPTGNLSQQNYAYDRYGNRTSVTATGVAANGTTMPTDGIPNLTFNTSNNRITTGGVEYYDSAGNQTRALGENGEWLRFEYDAANRLQIVRKDDTNQTMLQAFQYGSTNARLIDYDATAGLNKFYASSADRFWPNTSNIQAFIHGQRATPILGDSQLSTITPNGTGGEYTEYGHPDRLGTSVIANQATGAVYEQAHLPFGKALYPESTVPKAATK